MVLGSLRDGIRGFGRSWWRLALVQALVLVGITVALGVAALLLQRVSGDVLAWISADPDTLDARALQATSILIALVAILTVPFQVAGLVASAVLVDAALAGARPRLWRAVAAGVARLVRGLVAVVLGALAVLLAIALAPVVVPVGLLGLAATGVVALVRLRRPGAAASWPGWRLWGLLAIPLAVAWWLLPVAILLPVAAVLEPAWPRRALRASVSAAAGRRWPILAVWLIALAVAAALVVGASALGGLLGDAGSVLLGGLAQLVAIPLPMAVAVALYRRAAGPRGRVLPPAPAPARPAADPALSPLVARVAVVASIALVLPLAIAVTPPVAAPARADPAAHAYVVTSAADSTDDGVLASGKDSCLASGPDCTIRAALALAQDDALAGASAATISFAGDTTVVLADALGFTAGGASVATGLLTIDGGGHAVVLDGGDAVQILSVVSQAASPADGTWDLSVSGVVFRSGRMSSGFAGGLLAGVPHTTLDATVFQANVGGIGAGAVFANALDVTRSAFLDNRASYPSATTYGGAIRATGAISIENSTFSGNGIGADFMPGINQGGDVYADDALTVVNSTFVNSQGGSLTAVGPSVVRNSLFTTDWTRGGFMCSGPFTGGRNLSWQGDTSCPGTTADQHPGFAVGALDTAGGVPVFPLGGVGNPAMGAGADCPAVDARGADRPAQGCDLGAVEFDGATGLTLEALPSPTVFGAVTLRATVSASSGAVPGGSVVFTFDGVAQPAVPLDDPDDPSDDVAVAELALTGLAGGTTYPYSAVFDAAGPYDDATAGPSSYTVAQVPVAVDLGCADPSAPECTGSPWAVTDTGSLRLLARVTDDRPGTAWIVLDPASDIPVTDAAVVEDGVATFDVPASALGRGAHDLYARYESDDEQHAGVSPVARPVSVLRTPVVTLRLAAPTAVYGDAADGTATVTVTGDGPTPTGTVTVDGRTATLDEDGVARIDVSDLPVARGEVDLAAAYGGDAVYGRLASAPVPFRTTPAGTTAEITDVSPAGPRYGDALEVEVAVRAEAPSDADPVGTVSITADGGTVGDAAVDPALLDRDGVHVYTVLVPGGALDAGEHTLVAAFAASPSFTDSGSGEVAVDVASAVTSTTLAASAPSVAWGEQVDLTARVDATATGLVPGGTVRFLADDDVLGTATLGPCDAPDADGCAVATLTVAASAIGVGTRDLSAVYLGADDFAGSTGGLPGYAVARATPVASVTAPGLIVHGQTARISVTVGAGAATPPDGATVAIVATPETGDPVSLGDVVLASGAGALDLPVGALPSGAYTIAAHYAGDEQRAPADATARVLVTLASTDIGVDAVARTTVPYGESTDVTVTVRNTSNDAAPEGEIVLRWLGHEVGRATLGSADDTRTPGVRTVTIPATFGAPIAAPETFWLEASFAGADGFSDASLSTSPEERPRITVAPLQAVVAVDADIVLGSPLAATATVTIPGAVDGMAPEGSVTFTVTASGAGGYGPSLSVPVVNGRASLADGFPFDIPVDLAGTWSVRATYVKGGADLRYVVTSPNDTAVDSATVAAGAASVTVDAPAAVEDGAPLSVDVEVTGAVTPTGTVQLRYDGGVVGEAALSGGRATVAGALPPTLPLGDLSLEVRYSGDSSLSSAASAPFTVRLVPQATAVSVTSTNRFVDLYPAIVGAHVGYTAHVTAAHGVPAGIVTFFRDATRIGQASVGIDGTAGILVQADTVWSGDIVARFTPASTRMAGSEGELAHSWVKAPVAVTVSSPSQVVVGAFPAVTVDVRLLWEEFPFLNGDLLPDGPPSGTVTVSDGLGTTCEVALTAVDDLRGTGSCVLSYGSLGARSLTATYEGDDSYVAATSAPASTTVMKGDPEVSIVTPDGAVWAGRTSIPVAWSVAGPSSGSVTIALGGDVVCTSTSLVGACDVAVPAYGRGHHDDETLTLTYSGDPLWNGRTATTTGTVIACVPLDPSTVTPDGRGTVTLSPAPTCGGGTGYWTTDFVQISVVAQNGYRVASISNQGWPYPDGDVFRWDGGRNANLLVHPERLLSGDTLLPMSIRALIEAQCIPVTIGALGIASRTDALNAVPPPDTPRACGDSPARAEADGTWTVMLPVGSTVDLRVQPGFAPQRTTFYGWSGVPDDVRYSDAVRVTIAPDQGAVWARFGPVCYTSVPTLAQPASGGTLRMSMPAPNCSNPRTGATGWVYDTPATGELVDDGTIPRSFFDGWGGDTSRYRPGTATTRDVGGVRTTVRPFTFSLRDSTFAIGAAYGRCYAVSTSVRGDASSGVPGTVSFGTASNCPLGAGSGSERWYREGTSVSLTAASTGTTLRFLGWSGLPIDPRSSVLDATVAFPLTADVTAAASFGTNANCRPFSLSTVPAGSLDLETTFALGPNACEAMYGPAFYDQGTDGNGILVNASPATPEAEGAEIVFAWATSPPGSPSGQSPTESDIWDRTTQLNEGIYGSTQIVAYACQFVAVAANVTSPSGRSVPSAGATNVDRASQSSLAGFVGMPAADCASGSDPASGYGGYAWTVGSQLLPIVTADPVAYRFTGWSGDVAGTGETPDAPLTLAGPGRRAQGEEYHRRIVANFQAICHTLSLPSDADKLEVITAPNCPGTDASQRMYLGGTDVVLHATDRDDTLFRNWVSGTDEIDQDDAHWASVTMTSDRTVVPYYSAKSASEQITEYGAMAGDLLAVASKKALGFATATMSAYLKTLVQKVTLVADGIGYLAQGLEALGVHGAVIDGMKNASTMVSSMISMLWAPFDCLTAWSAGGEDTAFFAAQNLLGTALVATMSTSAAQQQAAAPTSTFQQLKAKAQELKAAAAPVKTGVSALQAAKSTYDAAASGSVGWESSAYDAWGSQASAAVFTSCLSGRATGVMDSMDSVLR